MEWKNKLTRTPYLVFFVVLLSIGVGTASAMITITLAGNVIITDDLTVDTDTLTVDSINDKVGIGTTSPTSALHITAGGNDFSPNENGIQLTGSDSGGNAGIELTTHGGTPFIDFHNDTDGSDYDARIILRGDDALAIRGANVGIDTNEPQAKLHVVGDVKIEGNLTGSNLFKTYVNEISLNNTGGNYLSGTVFCDEGDIRVGGGGHVVSGTLDEVLVSSLPNSLGEGWSAIFKNPDNDMSSSYRSYIVCLDLDPIH